MEENSLGRDSTRKKNKTNEDIFSISFHLPRGQVRFSDMLNLHLFDLKCFCCYALCKRLSRNLNFSLVSMQKKQANDSNHFSWLSSFNLLVLVYKECPIFSEYQVSFYNQLRPGNSKTTVIFSL